MTSTNFTACSYLFLILFAVSSTKLITADYRSVPSDAHLTLQGKKIQTIPKDDAKYMAYTQIVEQLKETMNLSANPCDSLYEFTCDNYNGGDLALPDALENIELTAEHLNNADYADSTRSTAVKKLLQFYRECQHSFSSRNYSTNDEYATKIIETFHKRTGLYFTMVWNQSDSASIRQPMNKDRLAIALSYLATRNVHPLIRASASTQSKNSSKYILILGQPEFFMSRDLFEDSMWAQLSRIYKSFVMKKLSDFAAIQSITLNKSKLAIDVQSLIEFERNLVLNYTSESNSDGESKLQRIDNLYKVETMRQQFQFLNFDHYLNNLAEDLPELKDYFDDERLIVVNDPILLERLDKNFDNIDHNLLANYLFYRLVLKLSNGYRQMGLKNGDHSSLSAMCVEEAMFIIKTPLTAVFLDSLYPNKTERSALMRSVRDLAEDIREQTITMVDQISSMDNETKNEAMIRIRNINMRLGYERIVEDEQLLDKHYEDLMFDENESYMSIFHKAYTFDERLKYKRMALNEEVIETIFHTSPLEIFAEYTKFDNSLMISIGYIDRFYNMGWPNAVKYAALGKTIAHELSHSISILDGFLEDDGAFNSSRNNFENVSKCLINQYNSFCEPITVLNSLFKPRKICADGDATLSENIGDNAGLYTAWTAYKNRQKLDGDDYRLPDPDFLEFSNDELFFIWHSYSHCRLLMSIDSYHIHTHPKYRVMGTIQNLDAFRNTFNCSSTSQYTSPKPCPIPI